MPVWAFAKAYTLLEQLALSTLQAILYLCFTIAVAHYFGWIERFIWWSLEREACKILNKTQVTLGSFRLDWSQVLQGKITFYASNVIIHTPQREIWGWESPLIARIGKAQVEVNALITIFHEIFLRVKLPIEVYSVVVEDIQVFVERQDQVFNVYLCDPAAVLPPAPYLSHPSSPQSIHGDEKGSSHDSLQIQNSADTIFSENNNSQRGGRLEPHKEQAEKLVQDMLNAVQSLGRAAQEGSLQSAVKKQGLEIAEILRDGLSTRNRDTSTLEQGVALIEQVGKVAVESFKAQKRILPERKLNDRIKPPDVRVGRIVIKDIRIFTKDSWIQISKNTESSGAAHGGGTFSPSSADVQGGKNKGNWNVPIFVGALIIRAAELCPPMSLKDDNDLPAVYQPADKIIEILWRRLLAEMAKSNTGRLFSTAVGEVLSFIKKTPHTSSNSNTTTSTTAITGGETGSESVVTTKATKTKATTKKARDFSLGSKSTKLNGGSNHKTPPSAERSETSKIPATETVKEIRV